MEEKKQLTRSVVAEALDRLTKQRDEAKAEADKRIVEFHYVRGQVDILTEIFEMLPEEQVVPAPEASPSSPPSSSGEPPAA